MHAMPDVFTQSKRSEVMSRIRGKGNRSTELKLLKLFREHGISGWRRHQPLPGRPDFVFPKELLAVFVDGKVECLQGLGMPTQAAGDGHSAHSPHAWALSSGLHLAFGQAATHQSRAHHSRQRHGVLCCAQLCPNIGKRRTAVHSMTLPRFAKR